MSAMYIYGLYLLYPNVQREHSVSCVFLFFGPVFLICGAKAPADVFSTDAWVVVQVAEEPARARVARERSPGRREIQSLKF
jgi:hypothetical protein